MRETPVLIAEPSGKLWVEYLVTLGAAGLLYGLTCGPAILWQDSGLFTYRIMHNDLEGKLGLALAHPLFIMAGMVAKSIPVGDLAHRVNFVSAVFGAVTIANVYLLLVLWTGRKFPGIVAAMTLALSWTFWQHSTIAEVYSLYAAIMTAELVVLLRYTQTSKVGWLYLLAFLNGLAIADHMWGILPLACYVVLAAVLLKRRAIVPGHILVMVAAWMLGAAPYEYLIIKDIIATGNVSGILASALFGSEWEGSVLNVRVSPRIAAENVAFLLMNFPTPNMLFLIAGVFVVWKAVPPRNFTAVIFAAMILFFVFAFRYTVPDRHAFFLPFYVIAAVFIGIGAGWFLARRNTRILKVFVIGLALLPIPAYVLAPTMAARFFKGLSSRVIPYRDEYRYWLQPWLTGYRGGERFAAEALGQVENNAIIYADSTTVYTMLYMQEQRGLRPDVSIVSGSDCSPGAPALTEQTIDGLLAGSAVYVVSSLPGYCPRFIIEKYDMAKEGVLCRVLKRKGSSS